MLANSNLMSCPLRTYPLRKPENHRVPVPRWTLSLPNDVTHVHTAYIGLQRHADTEDARSALAFAIYAMKDWVMEKEEADAMVSESFVDIGLDDGDVQDVAVWVCYWSNAGKGKISSKQLDLSSIHASLATSGRALIGLWQESFSSDVSRLETNYSGLDYLPGLAKLPGASTKEHTLSAYWGAARDRIPDSAHDLFPKPADIQPSGPAHHGLGQHLVGTNNANMVHIRSGQFWENCGQQEADSYEQKLEGTLRAGLTYLHENPKETNAMSIRYLRNSDLPSVAQDRDRKETCGAGFFANLEDLERWAHTHQSHLKIYRGAMAHYKAFGDLRSFRTWHEVSVIRDGDAKFEYVNCVPREGMLVRLEGRQE
jgi:hypothetical protein